jgi:hypothetical protein
MSEMDCLLEQIEYSQQVLSRTDVRLGGEADKRFQVLSEHATRQLRYRNVGILITTEPHVR